jgi:hypothetical protein
MIILPLTLGRKKLDNFYLMEESDLERKTKRQLFAALCGWRTGLEPATFGTTIRRSTS